MNTENKTETKNYDLCKIQQRLVAKKDAYNSFGKYKYRSCESILAAVKPILAEYEMSLVLSDDMVILGDRVYVKAIATLLDKNGDIVERTSAFAREALMKKGMDESQCTGSASSYARKYALCGMFAIDDSSVDPDATNDHSSGTRLTDEERKRVMNCDSKETLVSVCKELVNAGRNKDEVSKAYKAALSVLSEGNK